jgi:uncharacterized protein (TIRG00374 family)
MIWLRRGLSLILLLVLIYFFWPLIGEFKAAAQLFRQANWIWLAVAILIQLVSYAFLTWLNALALQPFPGKIGFLTLAAVLTSMAFIQIAIPSAGASGVALRVRLLRKFGFAPEDSLFSLAVETILEAVALISVACLGLVYLLRSGQLPLTNAAWLVVAGAASAGIVWYAWRILRNRERSRRIALALVCWWNRVGRRLRTFDFGRVEARLSAFQDNLARYSRGHLWKLILAAYGKVVLDVATLGAGFLLIGYAISPGTLYTGYGLILSFSGLAALPGGIGMADAYVPVIFSWLSVPGSVALVAGLVYRLIAFWLLRFCGFLTWQYLENRM